MAVLLLSPLTVEAGSYTVAFTGGAAPTVTRTNANFIDPTRNSSSFGPAGQTAEAYSSASPRSGDANSFIIQANPGPALITATFTWVPASGQNQATDPPPACILIEKNATARWYIKSMGGTGSGSGTADCGLPGAVTTTYMGSDNCPMVFSSADNWEVLSSPGASFYRSFQPSVSFTGQTGAEGSVDGAVDISCGAAAYPVTIDLTGQNSANQALTGQQITATLNGIPTNCPVTSYTWTQPSATCFKTYNENAASNQLVALGSADLTGPASGSTGVAPLAFYDRAQESLTATCTVTITPSNGTSLTFTATSPSVSILKPSVTHWDIVQGYVQYNPSYNSEYGPLQAFGLFGDLQCHRRQQRWNDLEKCHSKCSCAILRQRPMHFYPTGQP